MWNDGCRRKTYLRLQFARRQAPQGDEHGQAISALCEPVPTENLIQSEELERVRVTDTRRDYRRCDRRTRGGVMLNKRPRLCVAVKASSSGCCRTVRLRKALCSRDLSGGSVGSVDQGIKMGFHRYTTGNCRFQTCVVSYATSKLSLDRRATHSHSHRIVPGQLLCLSVDWLSARLTLPYQTLRKC
jgi:hypothetical protein